MKNQFEQEGGEPMRPAACNLCEALLPDAVDGTLSAAEQRIFDGHVASCVACSRELEQAQRGAAWLSMLKSQTPEPPADLLAKILAGTTGPQTAAAPAPVAQIAPEAWIAPPVAAPVHGTSWGVRLASWRSRVTDIFAIENARATFQPRFAMTAAMAFFSIALTLNLTGFRFRDLHADSFTPSGIRRAVSEASASATRNFQNLRVVYQVEARVSELRDDQTPNAGAQDAPGALRFEAEPQKETTPQDAPAAKPESGAQDKDKQDDNRPHGRSELVLPMPERNGRTDASHKAA